MNTTMVSVLKQITAQYGEDVLEDPRRLRALFSDLARDEPKPLRMAFSKCVENGFYRVIKDTRPAEERREVIDSLVRRLRDDEGLDITFYTEALELLAAAVFGEGAVAPGAAPETPHKPEAVVTTEEVYMGEEKAENGSETIAENISHLYTLNKVQNSLKVEICARPEQKQ